MTTRLDAIGLAAVLLAMLATFGSAAKPLVVDPLHRVAATLAALEAPTAPLR